MHDGSKTHVKISFQLGTLFYGELILPIIKKLWPLLGQKCTFDRLKPSRSQTMQLIHSNVLPEKTLICFSHKCQITRLYDEVKTVFESYKGQPGDFFLHLINTYILSCNVEMVSLTGIKLYSV